MAVICPTVTATDPHEYREQMERITKFSHRIHLDFMDGDLAPTESPPIESAWWPANLVVDLHLMYQRPQEYLHKVFHLKPSLVILHAEADGHFVGMAEQLHQAGIKAGVALLQQTTVDLIKPGLEHIDHVLIFSGDLGHFGGQADFSLLDKVKKLRSLKKTLEIGWDGGINAENVTALVQGGVDVLNVGGFIQKADSPQEAYATLEALAGKQM